MALTHFSKNKTLVLLSGFFLCCTAGAEASEQTLHPSHLQGHLHSFVDLRLAITDKETSLFDQGTGKLRYGGDASGERQYLLTLAQWALLGRYHFDWEWSAHFYVKTDEEQQTLWDPVEAYIQYKPAPQSRWRFDARAGLFFPEISQENIAPGWRSPYTITPSAINSWFGEELRAIGMEANAIYQLQNRNQWGMTGALITANDPLGALLAWRGWSLHDRNTGFNDRMPLPDTPDLQEGGMFAAQMNGVEPFHEIDHDLGYYLAIHGKQARQWQWHLLYYNNHGDIKHPIEKGQYAWATHFVHVGGHWRISPTLTALTQAIKGNTQMGWTQRGAPVDNDFWAAYLLISKTWQPHRLSLRYDRFAVDDQDWAPEDNNHESGHAWTGSYHFRWNDKATFATEMIYTDNKRAIRKAMGEPEQQHQWLGQLSLRYLLW